MQIIMYFCLVFVAFLFLFDRFCIQTRYIMSLKAVTRHVDTCPLQTQKEPPAPEALSKKKNTDNSLLAVLV